MQTRLVIMQELIARRKALRSEEIEVCPAKGSGQQARALRGSRRERQQIELTGERPRWYQTPRRVHSSVARRCREDSGAKGSPLRARQRPHTQARPGSPKVVDALLLVAGRVSLREPTIQHQRGKGCHHMLEVGLELVAGRALV